MRKDDFLNRLEQLIINKAYPTDSILTLLHSATNENFMANEIHKKMFEYTGDITFAERITFLYRLFYKGNKIFDKHMLLAIKEAKTIS